MTVDLVYYRRPIFAVFILNRQINTALRDIGNGAAINYPLVIAGFLIAVGIYNGYFFPLFLIASRIDSGIVRSPSGTLMVGFSPLRISVILFSISCHGSFSSSKV